MMTERRRTGDGGGRLKGIITVGPEGVLIHHSVKQVWSGGVGVGERRVFLLPVGVQELLPLSPHGLLSGRRKGSVSLLWLFSSSLALSLSLSDWLLAPPPLSVLSEPLGGVWTSRLADRMIV